MQELAASFQDIAGTITSVVTSIAFSQVRVLGVDIEWAVVWLAVPMLFFTIYLGFVNIRCFPMSIRILKGHYADPDAPGEVCLLYTSPSPRDRTRSRMPSSA